MATLQEEGTSNVKPKSLKEAIILVLQEAGPGGLTVRQMVQRIKKKFSWDWENDEQGDVSVISACFGDSDIFVRVAPWTYALWALQDHDCDPNEKPAKPKISLKEAIIDVLEEAGPGGLTVKEMVQRIKKKFSWDWKNDESGYSSVSSACNSPSNRDIFAHVAPGTFALWELQDDDFTPYVYEKPVKPKTLKEAIILVLQEAGPGGLHTKEVVQRINKKKWWDWKNDESGYDSVTALCCEPSNGDVFVRVAPGTYALWALQDDDFTPYVKPMELKEAIIRVLQEAGPEGLHIKEVVQRIKKKKWWDWKNDESGYNSLTALCCEPSNGGIFVRVAPGTYALWELQDDDFTPYDKPKTLKEAIIRVLQEAGPGGLQLKEIVQKIKKKKWWDWENDKQGPISVSGTCRLWPDVFVKHSPGVYALRSLQGEEGEAEGGSSRALAKANASDVERPSSGAKRTREAASKSGDELNQITEKKQKKGAEEHIEEPQSDPVAMPVVEEKRLLLYTTEQKAAADAWFERAFEQALANRLQEMEKGSNPNKRCSTA